jgi:hypothetical protein
MDGDLPNEMLGFNSLTHETEHRHTLFAGK